MHLLDSGADGLRVRRRPLDRQLRMYLNEKLDKLADVKIGNPGFVGYFGISTWTRAYCLVCFIVSAVFFTAAK
jgi:hypothetical protein